VSTSLPRKAKSQTSRPLSRTSLRQCIGRLPVEGLAIGRSRCEWFGNGWAIDGTNEHLSAKKVCDE
jgi:hypothetical protein